MGKIDRKFKFVAVNPSTGSIVTEENGVVFRAHDRAFKEILPDYLAACIRLGADEAQISGIKLLIGRVEEYQNANVSKVPDITGEREISAVLYDD